MENGNQPVCDWDSDDEAHLENRNISELISKLRYEFRQAKFDSVEETLVLRETKLKRECERLKYQLDFERLERIKIEKEFRDYKPEVSELERLRESQTIMKEEVKMAEERAEMAEEKFDKLLGRFKDRLGDKLELIELKSEMEKLKSANGGIEAENRQWEKKLGVLAARVAELERDTAFVLRNPDANFVISEQENSSGHSSKLAAGVGSPPPSTVKRNEDENCAGGTGKLAHVETILIEDSDDEAPGDFSRKQSSEKLAERGGTTGGERCSNVLKRERSSPTRIDVDENSRGVSVPCSKMSKHQERFLEANGSLLNTSANGTPAANDAENLNGSSDREQSAIKRSAGTKRNFENFLKERRNLIDDAGMEWQNTSEQEGKKSKGKKGTRGPTKMTSLTMKSHENRLSIEINQYGNAIGEGRENFYSYLGVCARTHVSITHKTWAKVPVEIKNKLWDALNSIYNLVEYVAYKKEILADAAKCWTQWKSRMAGQYIHVENPLDHPPEDYKDFITQEEWMEFCAYRLSPAFLEKREKSKANQKKNIYPHHIGRAGYTGITQELVEEFGEDYDRSKLWLHIRKDKDGNYPSEATQRISEKIESLTQQATVGEIILEGRHDILSLALPNKEHPGRVRGLGKHRNWSNTWNSPTHRGWASQFEKVGSALQQLQERFKMLEEQLQRKERGSSAKGSREGCSPT